MIKKFIKIYIASTLQSTPRCQFHPTKSKTTLNPLTHHPNFDIKTLKQRRTKMMSRWSKCSKQTNHVPISQLNSIQIHLPIINHTTKVPTSTWKAKKERKRDSILSKCPNGTHFNPVQKLNFTKIHTIYQNPKFGTQKKTFKLPKKKIKIESKSSI